MKAKLTYIVLTLVLVFSLIAVIIPTSPVSAQTTWYVDDDNCPGPGTGTLVDPFCSIQNAIGNASADDTIIIAAGTYNEHDITINKSLTIQGAGAGITFVDGQKLSRVFCINNSTVDMFGITIRNGNTTDNGGGIYNDHGNVTLTSCTVSGNYAEDNGGGIYNDDYNMTLTNCNISENEAYTGGGIYNEDGNMTMTNCTISGNNSKNDGGGIYNEEEMTMTDCTISNNSSSDEPGGGICNLGTLNMTNCTVSDNDADDWGGGICNMDVLKLTNCTVSGNDANEDGGGIWNDTGNVTLTNCTISGNTADSGGGVISNVSINITCTIVYGNTVVNDGPNLYGPYNDNGGESIVGSPNPLLGPLQNNGGTTNTSALGIGSPAIDACIVSCNLTTDQRGLPRPVDGDLDGTYFCDVGAYERQVAVGGIVEPVDLLQILAPWLGLAALIVVAITTAVVIRRRAT